MKPLFQDIKLQNRAKKLLSAWSKNPKKYPEIQHAIESWVQDLLAEYEAKEKKRKQGEKFIQTLGNK